MKVHIFIVCSIVFCFTLCKEITLNKQSDRYVLKANIGNLNMNLNPVLSLQRKHTWIKSQDCKYCQAIDSKEDKQTDRKGVQKIDDKMYDCSKSCFDKGQDQYGLKCVQTNNKCKVLKNNFELNIDSSRKLIGKLIEVKIQAKASDQKFDQFHTVLVERIIDSQSEPLSDKNQLAPQSVVSPIGQYMIWGADALFQSNILTKNSKQQLVIYDSLKSNNLQKQLLTDFTPIQIEFQQTVTQFTLSQIKLSQKITLNHAQKLTQDHQIPIQPLQKGFFTLQTQNLVLSKKHHQKLIQHLLTTYFSTQNNHCQFKDNKISCLKSLSLDKLQYLQLQLILNGISIGFPFKALLKNCKSKSCDLRISLSQVQSSFALGTFFLEVFAVQFIQQTQNIKLYRLDNQSNQFYSNNQKYHKENFNILWWIGSSLFYAIFYVFKIIFYLALFSLLINFLYHWRKVIEWGGMIFDKIKKRKSSSESNELFENEEDLEAKDTAKLIRSFRNRRNKVFVQDQNEHLNDQITTQESN